MINNWVDELGDGSSKIGDVKQFSTKFSQNNITMSRKGFKKVVL